MSSIDLYWLPLGAGGSFVRSNGRLYEAVVARAQRRRPLDLYHSALVLTTGFGSFVVEQAWPSPSGDGAAARGVVGEGPVGVRAAGRLRILRYEVRRWRDGTIADLDAAVESPRRLTGDPAVVKRAFSLVPSAPTPVWGRDELRADEMWNSNSLVSWLLARAGLDAEAVPAPSGGRAPGWAAGVRVARRADTNVRS